MVTMLSGYDSKLTKSVIDELIALSRKKDISLLDLYSSYISTHEIFEQI